LPVSNVPSVDALGLTRPNAALAALDRRPTAEEFIAAVPPIEVDADIAVCDGGDPRLGHSLQYIQLNKIDPREPETCKYCGLRYIRKAHH